MTNYSKNENVNVSVGFRVCSRYFDLKSVWGVVFYSRIVEINLRTINLYNKFSCVDCVLLSF
jgi:hypothetical protein